MAGMVRVVEPQDLVEVCAWRQLEYIIMEELKRRLEMAFKWMEIISLEVPLEGEFRLLPLLK